MIEWFKEIQKEIRAHGSVKATTFSLMETLEEHGLYHIGVPGNEILSEVSNAVKVVIKRGEPPKRLQNKQHSLSELYDLQGRLVLIGSNYKASIGMERVNDFREVMVDIRTLVRDFILSLMSVYVNILAPAECLPGR